MKKLMIPIITGVMIIGIAALAVFALILPAYNQKSISGDPINQNQSTEVIFTELSKHTPVEFLEFLKSKPAGFVTVDNAPEGWISKKDVKKLILLVDSKEPCASVVSIISSSLPSSGSTIGHEAMFLLEGYKSDRYPPALNSKSDALKMDPAEYKSWWEKSTH